MTQALHKLAGPEDIKTEDYDEDQPLANLQRTLQGGDTHMNAASAPTLPDTLVQVVNKVATHVEEAIPKVFSAAPSTTPVGMPNGSATIKQVRKAAGKLLMAKSVASPPHPMHQPHLEVAIQPTGVEKTKQISTKGHAMIDTGAAVTLVTQAWATAHGLKVTQGKKISVKGAGGAAIPVLGYTQFTMQLTPTLEVDLSGVIVAEGQFYQCLLGGDILGGKLGILGPAKIEMPGASTPGSIQWKQER